MNAKTASLILVTLLWGCTEEAQVLENQSQSGALNHGDAGHHQPDGGVPGGGKPCGEDADAGAVEEMDAGQVDSGWDAGVDAGSGGGVVDAGSLTCADAGVVCDPATCAGCCNNGRCELGTFNDQCGAGGGACQVCGASKVCSWGKCLPTWPGADLVVERARLTDFFRSTTELRFTAWVVIANIGQQDAGPTTWGVLYSSDRNVSAFNDPLVSELPTPAIAAGARVTVSGRVTVPIANITTAQAYAAVATDFYAAQPEYDESNNIWLSDAFDTASALCGAGICNGCCTPDGCSTVAEETDMACGIAGATCSSCYGSKICTAGVCDYP